MKDKKQIIRDTANYGAATYLTLVTSFVASMIQKRLLGPTLTGIWNALALVKMYTQFGDFGVTRGVELKLPPLFAHQKKEAYNEIQDIGCTSGMAAMLLINFGLIIATFFYADSGNALYLNAIRIIAVIGVLEYLCTYMEVSSLRCKSNFALLGSQIVSSEILFSIISLLGVYFFKLYGLLCALGIMIIYKIAFILYKTRDRYSIRFDKKISFELIRIGAPLLVSGFLLRTLENLDRIVIVKYLSLQMLGFYSIALMLFTSVNNFPALVAAVVYPRSVAVFKEEKDFNKLLAYLLKFQSALMLIMMLTVALCVFIFPVFINHYLVKFIYGIASMKILLFCALFSALVYMPYQYCIIMNKRWFLVFIVLGIMGIYFILLLGSCNKQIFGLKDINLVAMLRLVVNFVFFLAVSILAFGYLGNLKKFAVYFIKASFTCLYFFILIVLIDRLFTPFPRKLLADLGIAAAKIFIFALAFLPVALNINRKIRIFQSVWELFLKGRIAKLRNYLDLILFP